MSKKQRIYLMTLWRNACEQQGWSHGDEARRHGLYAEVLGQPKRFSDFTQADFDAVKAKFLELAEDLSGAIEADAPEVGERRRLLWVITNQQLPELAVYVEDAQSYLASVIRDKFTAAAGVKNLQTLSATRYHPEQPSELEMLRMTLAARISSLRSKTRDSVADMRKKAKYPTRPGAKPRQQKESAPVRELVVSGGGECPF